MGRARSGLDAIAAVAVGGTSLFGGIGSVWGTFLGTLIITIVNNLLNLMNVSPYTQGIAKGLDHPDRDRALSAEDPKHGEVVQVIWKVKHAQGCAKCRRRARGLASRLDPRRMTAEERMPSLYSGSDRQVANQ